MRTLRASALAASVVFLGLGSASAQQPLNSDLPPLEPPSGPVPRASTTASAPREERATDVPEANDPTGPPATQPRETIGPPPGPGAFYVQGSYVPSGKRTVWRPGFWARVQPGREWIPARWERRSEGWTFREGYWTSSRDDGASTTAPFAPRNSPPAPLISEPREPADRHVVARPSAPEGNPVDPPSAELPPIPDENIPAGSPPAAGPDNAAPAEPRPLEPSTVLPMPAPGAGRPPIPYWDGSTLMVPPTRFGPGVVVATDPRMLGNRLVYPPVGLLPPGPARNGDPLYGGPAPRPGYRPVYAGPRGGLIPGPVRNFLNRVRP